MYEQRNGVIRRIIPYRNTKIRNHVNGSSQLGISCVITFMRNLFFRSFLLLPGVATLAIVITGCDTTSTTVVSQTVDNIVWLPNESSGMLAFIDKVYENVDGSESDGQNLYQVNT